MNSTPQLLSEHACFGGVQRFYQHASREIGLPMRFSVFLPPQAEQGKVPALLYLAGLTCNEETFAIKAGAQRLAAEQGLALVACDMPFIRREAVALVLAGLAGHDVAVPATPSGLEPLHAAYRKSCAPVIASQLEEGDLKVTDFFEKVDVRYVPWEELLRIDPGGRLLTNVNEPDDMRRATGLADDGEGKAECR